MAGYFMYDPWGNVLPGSTEQPKAPSWSNPENWDPVLGDRVKIHFKANDPWKNNYDKYDIRDGDEAVVSEPHGHTVDQRYLVHFVKPRSILGGMVFHRDDLEWLPREGEREDLER